MELCTTVTHSACVSDEDGFHLSYQDADRLLARLLAWLLSTRYTQVASMMMEVLGKRNGRSAGSSSRALGAGQTGLEHSFRLLVVFVGAHPVSSTPCRFEMGEPDEASSTIDPAVAALIIVPSGPPSARLARLRPGRLAAPRPAAPGLDRRCRVSLEAALASPGPHHRIFAFNRQGDEWRPAQQSRRLWMDTHATRDHDSGVTRRNNAALRQHQSPFFSLRLLYAQRHLSLRHPSCCWMDRSSGANLARRRILAAQRLQRLPASPLIGRPTWSVPASEPRPIFCFVVQSSLLAPVITTTTTLNPVFARLR